MQIIGDTKEYIFILKLDNNMTKKDMIKANNKSNKKVFNKVYNLPKYISNKKRLFVPVIGYIFIVLFFSTVYWCMFRKNSTSFLITDQFNKHLSIYLSGKFTFNDYIIL